MPSALRSKARTPETTAGALCGVFRAPRSAYEQPEPDGQQPLRVDGWQVTGHLVPWGTFHRGTGLPSDDFKGDDFADFQETGGVVETSDGGTVQVGHLTIGGGHAPGGTLPAQAALEHYDEVGTVWAHVRAVEGKHGVWVSGTVAPGVTELMLHKARALPPSGDWRWNDPAGRYKLMAACQVVVPGYPSRDDLRARIASGEHPALVASAFGWADGHGARTAAADLPDLGGPTFRVLIFPEGTLEDGPVSRDGRIVEKGATVWAEGEPMPLSWKEADGGYGHDGSVVVGRIDEVTRDEQSRVWGVGQLDGNPDNKAAQLATSLIAGGMLRGISADLGEMRGTYLGGEIEVWDVTEDADGDPSTPEVITIPDEPFDTAEPFMTVQYAELVGATLTISEAYREGTIELTSDAPAMEVEPLAVAASVRGRHRVVPFRVVGKRARQAASVPVEEQLAAAARTVEALTARVASLEVQVAEHRPTVRALARQARAAATAALTSRE